MMRTIGFCHLLLQSRAPVSRSLPTRSSRIGHPAVSRRQRGWSGESLEFQLFSTSCRACHVSSAAPACGSLRSGPRIVKASRSLATTLVKASPCRGPARLRSKGALLQRASCDARRARTRRGSFVRTCSTPTVLPPSGRALRLFAAAIPRWFFQTRLLRLGPRSRPRSNRCGRFLGPDAAFRLLQRIFNGRHTSTNPRASSSPAAGGCPVVVATHDALSRWPRLPLFLQRRCDLDAPQRATRSSPTPDLESRAPQSGQALRPFERHLSGGPEGHGKRVGRKS